MLHSGCLYLQFHLTGVPITFVYGKETKGGGLIHHHRGILRGRGDSFHHCTSILRGLKLPILLGFSSVCKRKGNSFTRVRPVAKPGKGRG